MKKIRIIPLLIVILMLVTSCKLTSFDTSTLLTAPLMSPSEQEMRNTISETIGSTYEPVYPKSGKYQTAITSVDLNGDKINEAVCFYKADTEQYVSIIVLQNKNNEWVSIGTAKSQANGIERVAFSDILKNGKKEIIIGWQYLKDGEENALEIFSLSGKSALKSEYTSMYNEFITFDKSLAVISKNSTSKTASASIIGDVDGVVSTVSTVSLNNSITSFEKIQTSTVSKSSTLIYIDEQLENQTYITELLLLSNKDKLSLESIDIENRTVRQKKYTCIDANNDGLLDIPVEKNLMPYIRNGNEECLSYVEWYSIKNNTLEYIKSTYSSVNEPFYIELPNDWIGKITIEKGIDHPDRTIHFYCLENKVPLFSIRVFTRLEYEDSDENDIWHEIASHGENVYTYRNDNENPPDYFDTDIDSISELFTVLS